MAEEKNNKQEEKQQASDVNEVSPIKPEPERVLFSWNNSSRPFKKRDREFWITILAIAGIFGTLLFVIEGAMPVILIISLIFLYFVLSTVEPEQVEYSITTKGVKIADKTTGWDFLIKYWFTEKLGSELLIFEMAIFPERLELVINPKDKEKIKKELNKYVFEEEAPPSTLDKIANWFARRLPGGNQQSSTTPKTT